MGTEDPTVAVDHAEQLHKWITGSEIVLLEGSDHVFEMSHPWEKEKLPAAMEKVVEKVTGFIYNNI